MSAPFFPREPARPSKPVIGVLCCNEIAERPIQAVASRFIEPLSCISGATVLLVPALIDVLDAASLTDRLDGLLLTGSRSNVCPTRYGASACTGDRVDEERDQVAFALAGHMIEHGKPVFGICRGLQELNVLFGGTLTAELGGETHHGDEDALSFEQLFEHCHDVRLVDGGMLAGAAGARRLKVNSVHRQGIDRLGTGLEIEALAVDDDLVEAFSARPCGGEVLAVQWHPEWNSAKSRVSQGFFGLIGSALRGGIAPIATSR
jgi:putative glutamine amidotransferase